MFFSILTLVYCFKKLYGEGGFQNRFKIQLVVRQHLNWLISFKLIDHSLKVDFGENKPDHKQKGEKSSLLAEHS